ncbi:MAG: hypothetical protein ABEK16_03520 [Candidatus Nanohalobium sp.]
MKLSNRLDRVRESIQGRKGLCVICGERVKEGHSYIESEEGYCHRGCIFSEKGSEPAEA